MGKNLLVIGLVVLLVGCVAWLKHDAPSSEESGRINGTLWGLMQHVPSFPAAEKIGSPAAEFEEQLRALGYAE